MRNSKRSRSPPTATLRNAFRRSEMHFDAPKCILTLRNAFRRSEMPTPTRTLATKMSCAAPVRVSHPPVPLRLTPWVANDWCPRNDREVRSKIERTNTLTGGIRRWSRCGIMTTSFPRIFAMGDYVPGLSDLPPVFDRYRILRQLGRGGMGAVYLADDTRLDRQVAIKIPSPHGLGDSALLQR